jgi:hypothetical protein
MKIEQQLNLQPQTQQHTNTGKNREYQVALINRNQQILQNSRNAYPSTQLSIEIHT